MHKAYKEQQSKLTLYIGDFEDKSLSSNSTMSSLMGDSYQQ